MCLNENSASFKYLSPVKAEPSTDYHCPPGTHFQCPGQDYCLPVYLRCNGVADCMGQEDEDGCEGYRCPGFYRCRGSAVCLHPDHVCDGMFQCPERDDELLCEAECPEENCVCRGLAFTCTTRVDLSRFTDVRYLDATGSGITPDQLRDNRMLVHLGLSRCDLQHVQHLSFPNLNSLDLSYNHISEVSTDHLLGLVSLRVLDLSANPLTSLFTSAKTTATVPSLRLLDLSQGAIRRINVSLVASFPNIEVMNLTFSGITHLAGNSSRFLPKLQVLLLEGCLVTDFPEEFFKELGHLRYLKSDNYKLCCSQVLPDQFDQNNCHAPMDTISSCDNLLSSTAYRAVLVAFAALSLTGNLACLVLRRVARRTNPESASTVFAAHLSASDLLMGVYVAVVRCADAVYEGRYVWEDSAWRHSAACRTASAFSSVSSFVSTALFFLMTLHCCLGMWSHSGRRFSVRSAHAASAVCWAGGVLLAVLPMLPKASRVGLYHLIGLCVPLPVISYSANSAAYQFFIVSSSLALTLTLLTTVGIAALYVVIRVRDDVIFVLTHDVTSSSQQRHDLAHARCVVLLAACRSLSWLPLTFATLMMMTSREDLVSKKVMLGLVVVMLPLSSSANPLLFLLHHVQERRRLVQRERLLKRMGLKRSTQTTAENQGVVDGHTL